MASSEEMFECSQCLKYYKTRIMDCVESERNQIATSLGLEEELRTGGQKPQKEVEVEVEI